MKDRFAADTTLALDQRPAVTRSLPFSDCKQTPGQHHIFIASQETPACCARVFRPRTIPLATNNFASDDPPSKPRLPSRSAESTAAQVSPGASAIAPE